MTKTANKNPVVGMNLSTRRTLALTATAILSFVIAYLTLSPSPPHVGLEELLSDKAYHVIAFAALIFPSALLYARSLIWVIPAALMFGGAIELIQPYVGREAEVADFLADAVGLSVGIVSGLILRMLLTKLLPAPAAPRN